MCSIVKNYLVYFPRKYTFAGAVIIFMRLSFRPSREYAASEFLELVMSVNERGCRQIVDLGFVIIASSVVKYTSVSFITIFEPLL